MRMQTFAVTALLTVMAGTAAEAHAFLDHAEPRVGSTVPTAPREIVLSYTQNLEPAFSSVEVSDASGARVDLGKPKIGASTMRVSFMARSGSSAPATTPISSPRGFRLWTGWLRNSRWARQ